LAVWNTNWYSKNRDVEWRSIVRGEEEFFVLIHKFSCLSVLSDVYPWI
jgi:hypothetical protein